MALNSETKKRTLLALLICSSVMMFRSCNGTLVKEEKKGIVIEPPKIEEIEFEGINIPTIDPEVVNDIETKYADGYPTTETTENVRGGK